MGDVPMMPNAIGVSRLRVVVGWAAVVLILILGIIFFGWIAYLGIHKHIWLSVAQQQFAAVIGLPGAAAASLFVVLVLRISAGPIELEVGPLKFKGAAGPIIFWLACFLAISLSIKMLWTT